MRLKKYCGFLIEKTLMKKSYLTFNDFSVSNFHSELDQSGRSEGIKLGRCRGLNWAGVGIQNVKTSRS